MIKQERANTSCSKEILIRYQEANAMCGVKKRNKFATAIVVSNFGDNQNVIRS